MGSPAGRSPAPTPLDLLEAFINTADLERGLEEIATPFALGKWLQARKLIGPSEVVTKADHQQALRLREGLRLAARANNGATIDRRNLRELNQLARRGSLMLAFGADGSARLDPATGGFEAAVARILAAAAEAILTGRWLRLKSCANDGCQWAFYDASKNRSGRWCDMADCGNQAKGKAFRERQRRN